MFEQRPIWSKAALAFETKFKRDQLKYLLPAVAYYFVTGPFRVMWVKMGYDPRKDSSSRIYQTLDYRIPNRGGFYPVILCYFICIVSLFLILLTQFVYPGTSLKKH